jgi:hypothetical protein
MITLEDVKKHARAAYAAGLLTAQAPNPNDRKCQYRKMCDDGVERYCAIGASVPNDLYNAARMSGPIGFVVRDFPGLFDHRMLFELKAIQAKHDTWASFGLNKPEFRKPFEEEFLALIKE